MNALPEKMIAIKNLKCASIQKVAIRALIKPLELPVLLDSRKIPQIIYARILMNALNEFTLARMTRDALTSQVVIHAKKLKLRSHQHRLQRQLKNRNLLRLRLVRTDIITRMIQIVALVSTYKYR